MYNCVTKMAKLLSGSGGAHCKLCTTTFAQAHGIDIVRDGFPINRSYMTPSYSPKINLNNLPTSDKRHHRCLSTTCIFTNFQLLFNTYNSQSKVRHNATRQKAGIKRKAKESQDSSHQILGETLQTVSESTAAKLPRLSSFKAPYSVSGYLSKQHLCNPPA